MYTVLPFSMMDLGLMATIGMIVFGLVTGIHPFSWHLFKNGGPDPDLQIGLSADIGFPGKKKVVLRVQNDLAAEEFVYQCELAWQSRRVVVEGAGRGKA